MGFSVKTCASSDEAAQALNADHAARFMAGGTLIMRSVNEGDQSFSTIVRTDEPALRRIQPQGDRVTIGAGVTMREILESRELEFLHPAARAIGGPAIRNMATVGGNLFAPHPYGDLATALLVLDASATVAGGGEIGIAQVIESRDRAPGPFVVSLSVIKPPHGTFRFLKVARIKPKGVSLITIAACLPQQAGVIAGARVAYGAVGPVPMRVSAVEQALEGKSLNAAGIAQALSVATSGIDIVSDGLATAWYREQVAPVHLARLLLEK